VEAVAKRFFVVPTKVHTKVPKDVHTKVPIEVPKDVHGAQDDATTMMIFDMDDDSHTPCPH